MSDRQTTSGQSHEPAQSDQRERRIAVSLASRLPDVLLPKGVACKLAGERRAVPLLNTKPWFVGLHSERGIAVPTFDIQAWLGDARAAQGRIVILTTHRQQLGLLTGELPRIVSISTTEAQPMPAPYQGFPPELAAHLHAGGVGEDGWYAEFDAIAWFADAVSAIHLYS